jgi:hypothetical protein
MTFRRFGVLDRQEPNVPKSFMPVPMQVFDSVWPIKRRARCIS